MYTSQQHNIIIGLLLGDGYLRKNDSGNRNRNAFLSVLRSLKDKAYSQYHVDILKDHITASGLKESSVFDKRTNKFYHRCTFSTKSSLYLTTLHAKWYQNGKKVIPKDLQLNSEIIATWFADDGYIEKSKNNYFRISLYTNGFSKEDVYFLRDLLQKRYNKKIIVRRIKTYYTLFLSDYAARKMIKDMSPVFPKGMGRKELWKGVEFGKEYSSK